jgi:FKBP-type peptidyl-prolyl cis-trans isomerase FkpA
VLGIYDIKIVKVIPKGNLSQQVFMGRCQAYIGTLADAAKKKEPITIKNYIASNNLKLTTTASGLQYVITQQGTGDKPAPGDTVLVNYVGRFLNGKVFDTNIKAEAIKAKLEINPMNPYKPVKFTMGIQGIIKGWNEGLALLSKGGKETLVVPSSLGYGDRGYQIIGPYTPMTFDVELVDVTHPNPNAPKPTPPASMLQVHPMPGQTKPAAAKK